MTTKIFDINGSATSDKNTIPRGFNTYFTNVGKTLQASLANLGNTIWENHEHANLWKKINPKEAQFSFVKVSVSDLLNILRKLKGSKAVAGCSKHN